MIFTKTTECAPIQEDVDFARGEFIVEVYTLELQGWVERPNSFCIIYVESEQIVRLAVDLYSPDDPATPELRAYRDDLWER